MSDLVERLRAMAEDIVSDLSWCEEAADEITRLRAEVEALKSSPVRFDAEPPPDCHMPSQCLARGACWQKCSLATQEPKG